MHARVRAATAVAASACRACVHRRQVSGVGAEDARSSGCDTVSLADVTRRNGPYTRNTHCSAVSIEQSLRSTSHGVHNVRGSPYAASRRRFRQCVGNGLLLACQLLPCHVRSAPQLPYLQRSVPLERRQRHAAASRRQLPQQAAALRPPSCATPLRHRVWPRQLAASLAPRMTRPDAPLQWQSERAAQEPRRAHKRT